MLLTNMQRIPQNNPINKGYSKCKKQSHSRKNSIHKNSPSNPNKNAPVQKNSRKKSSQLNNKEKNSQSELKLALQLAQYHKRISEQEKSKAASLGREVQNLKAQISRLWQANRTSGENERKWEQKYKKIKQKYRQLKKFQCSQKKSSEEKQAKAKNPEQSFLLSYATQKLQRLTQQVYAKNIAIIEISKKIEQYEVCTANNAKLVDLLEQRVSQLALQNQMLRKDLGKKQWEGKNRKNSINMKQSEQLSKGKENKHENLKCNNSQALRSKINGYNNENTFELSRVSSIRDYQQRVLGQRSRRRQSQSNLNRNEERQKNGQRSYLIGEQNDEDSEHYGKYMSIC